MSVETEAVEVNLWVLERLNDASPGKPLVPTSVVIALESRENVFLLSGSEERSGCGVIIDEEVSGNGADDS